MMVTNNHNIPPHAAKNGKVTDNKHEATDEGADGSDDGCDTGTIGDSDSDTDENVKKVDTNPK